MAINERLVHTASAAGTGNQEEGLILHLDANDVDSYDGDGDVWYDIHDHEYTPATNVSEHFNTVTYTGNDGINEITGVGFQPDLVWIKRRNSSTYNHVIRDSVRGTDSVLSSDTNNAESVVSNRFEFITDGFKHLVGTQGANNSAGTYVAWCFKAGGAPTTTNTATSGAMTANSVSIDGVLESSYTPSGSPDIYPDKMSVNTDLGFSVIQYGGSGAQETLPHGLGQNPELMIFKRTNTAASWLVSDGTSMGYLDLNDSFSTTRHNQYINSVDANTIEINNVAGINGSSDEMIAYCFASKRGVSKVGSYIGTGASGNKIYTGFEPAFLLQKETNTSGVNWHIWDNVRDSNPIENILIPNTNSAEGSVSSGITFNRDGFTINTTNGSINGNGDNYIYYAVAKDTNETSLYTTDLELNLGADSYSGSGDWLDSSGNGNNGTITGATWEEELGNFFDFNGSSDKINITSTATTPIDFTTKNYTIEAWINPDTSGSNQIFTKYGSSDSLRSISVMVHSDNTLRLLQRTSTSNNSYSTSTIPQNTWTHIAITRSSSDVKFYINGELDNTVASTFTPNSGGSQDIIIGANGSGTPSYFNGKIGQVRAYSTELSLTEIRKNFNFTKPKYPNEFHFDKLVSPTWNSGGYFDFNGSGDSFQNTSTAINNLTGFSLSIWFRPNSSSDLFNLINKYGANDERTFSIYRWSGTDSGGVVISSFYSFSSGGGNAVALPGNTFSANTWYHLVFVADGVNRPKTYIDNVQTGTSQYDSEATNKVAWYPDVPIIIGKSAFTSDYDFNGRISKVKMFKGGISEDKIEELYNEGY